MTLQNNFSENLMIKNKKKTKLNFLKEINMFRNSRPTFQDHVHFNSLKFCEVIDSQS